MPFNFILILHFFLLCVKMMVLFHIDIVNIIHIIFDWFDGIAIVFDWLDEITRKGACCVNGILRQCEGNQDKNGEGYEEFHLKVCVPYIQKLRESHNKQSHHCHRAEYAS